MKDAYRSIKAPVTHTLKIEGSKFIASAFPVDLRPQAEEILKEIRKKYYDATHHCFAYGLGSERKDFRFSDDGEPSGTAGPKIFSAIESKDFSDILVVVTRYFGGTKLGVGGLGRAYFDSANLALADAAVVSKVLTKELRITFPYDETSRVMNALSRYSAKIIETLYEDDVTLHCSVRQGMVKEFTADLTDITRGNIDFKTLR